MGRIEDWKTREVGGACLFEKLRGKARSGVASNDGEVPKLQRTASDDEQGKPRLPPTKGVQESGDGYAPNSSRKRRALRTDSVEALQDYPEGIEPVRSLRDDWREIRGLGYALIFETLKTALLILVVLVRLGAAGARNVERWLGEEVLLEGHKKEDSAEKKDSTRKESLTDDKRRDNQRITDDTTETTNLTDH